MVTPEFTENSLLDQLKLMTSIMFKTSGIVIHITGDFKDEQLLSNDQKLALYRIAQEQCTNISKYAEASTINIILSIKSAQVKLTVADNGKGAVKENYTGGIGLTNIRHRLTLLGGNTHIDTAENDGFRLLVEFPLSTTQTDPSVLEKQLNH